MQDFQELEERMNQLEKAAKAVEELDFISFDDLFSPSFMKEYTTFSSVEEFFDAGGFQLESQAAYEAIPEAQLDAHVQATTKFRTWKAMLETATSIFAIKPMGL
jgi:hypothetical protein